MSRLRGSIVVLIALLTCLLGAAMVTGTYDAGRPWVVLLRIAVGMIAIVALCKTVFFSHTKQPSPPGKPEVQEPAKREIAQAYYYVKHNYSPHIIGMIAKMLIDLPEYLERINEEVTLSEESPQLKIITHQMYRIGSLSDSKKKMDPSNHLLIPVVLVSKGVLLDNFTVSDASGRVLPTLSYNQTRGLLAHVIRFIINSLPEKADGPRGRERKKQHDKAIVDLGQAVCYPGPRKKQELKIQNKISELLDSIGDLPVEDTWKKRVRAFCETLVDHYVIVAEASVDHGNYITLSYAQDIPIEQSSTRNKWRGRLGLRYSTVDIPLHAYAVRTESYHLQMNAGPMEYIFDHHLEWLRSGDTVKPGELHWGNFIPYVRIHYGSANPAAHLYIRRQSSSGEATEALRQASAKKGVDKASHIDQLKSVVAFREIPPGALGAATVVSLVTTAIVCFFALTRIGQEPTRASPVSTLGSDIPALLIALPAVASLIIGSWLDLSHLRRASLTTYLGLGSSLILSLASALYFLWNAYDILPGRLMLELPGKITVRTDVGWLILAGLTITCSLFLCRDVFTTSRYYFSLIRRRVRERADG